MIKLSATFLLSLLTITSCDYQFLNIFDSNAHKVPFPSSAVSVCNDIDNKDVLISDENWIWTYNERIGRIEKKERRMTGKTHLILIAITEI